MWPRSPGEESPEGRAAVILTPDQRVRVFISLTLEELAAGRTAPRRAAGARTSARSSADQPGRCLREAARCPGQQCDYITFLEAGGRRRTVTVCRGHLQAIATEGGAAGARACNRGDDDGPIRPDDRCQLVASRPARRGHLGKSDPPEGRIRTDSSPGKVRKPLGAGLRSGAALVSALGIEPPDLRITRVFLCVARRVKACGSFT